MFDINNKTCIYVIEQWIPDDCPIPLTANKTTAHSGTYNPVSFPDLNQAIFGDCKPKYKYKKYLGFWRSSICWLNLLLYCFFIPIYAVLSNLFLF